ncbi:FkbM family methyltransferase [Prosthecobacter vanneervenii]|uniref:FkbM family methyltransferase n=1 Tax=Prosthecobacter vanneervenii TaxID=48466 RepID=A0A7W7Y6F6_9BACT|nr:FkbM family methyltransferase [Prosthecobacter vanneervenii]MBB5030466.1 FkbM family methyltransferase [Prosthecobacter vanneervenii]
MAYSKFKLVRGLQKVLSGKLPDFLFPLVEKIRYREWHRLERGEITEIFWPVGAGAKLRLHKDSFLCRPIVRGKFELGERKLLARLLKPGDVFVDVGANIGLFAVIAGKCVGSQGVVLAVEPSLPTCKILQSQLDLNKLQNVKICQVGISKESGELELFQGTNINDTFNSFSPPIWEGEYTPTKVPVITFDSLIAQHLAGRPIRLVKIDTEGWECQVLAGGSIFARPDAPELIIEFCDKALLASASSCEALYNALRSLGYTTFVIDMENGKLQPLNQSREFEYANVFATKSPDRHRNFIVS